MFSFLQVNFGYSKFVMIVSLYCCLYCCLWYFDCTKLCRCIQMHCSVYCYVFRVYIESILEHFTAITSARRQHVITVKQFYWPDQIYYVIYPEFDTLYLRAVHVSAHQVSILAWLDMGGVLGSVLLPQLVLSNYIFLVKLWLLAMT